MGETSHPPGILDQVYQLRASVSDNGSIISTVYPFVSFPNSLENCGR